VKRANGGEKESKVESRKSWRKSRIKMRKYVLRTKKYSEKILGRAPKAYRGNIGKKEKRLTGKEMLRSYTTLQEERTWERKV